MLSPFGLGVLDLAVGSFVLEAAIASNATIAIPDFFSNPARWQNQPSTGLFHTEHRRTCEGGPNAAIA